MPRMHLFVLVSMILMGRASAGAPLPELFFDDFQNGMERWETTDPDPSKPSWEVVEVERKGKPSQVLRVLGKSDYEPPHRSPHSIALVKDVVVGDFELTAEVQNTNPSGGGHRDLCFFWGYRDPAHFYYVHLGAKADPHSCQVFVVDDAPRTKITTTEAEGTPWTDGWHRVKIVRDVAAGTVSVYFDNMKKPLMTANDNRFHEGRVGVGTFDDSGNFDNVMLRGRDVQKK